MTKQTTKVVWKRAKWLYLAVAVVMLLFAFDSIHTVNSNYQSAQDHMMTSMQFKQDQKKPQSKRRAVQKTYDKYRLDTLSLYSRYPAGSLSSKVLPNPGGLGGPAINLFVQLFMFLFGLIIAGWDHFGHFERFIFASGIKRKSYYWQRTLLGTLLAGGGTLITYLLIFGGERLALPARYFNITGSQTAGLLLYNTLFAAAAFAFGALLAMVCGRLWQLAAIAALLVPISETVVTNVSMWLGSLTGLNDYDASTGGYLNMGLDTPAWGYWYLVGLFAVVLVFALLMGAYCYQRFSLENDGQTLVVPKLKWLAIVLAVVAAFGLSITLSRHGRLLLGKSLVLPVIVLALGLVWQFWPQLMQLRRQLRQRKLAR